jgi:hypothetical protein
MNEYLIDGVKGVSALNAAHPLSRRTLIRAMKSLKRRGKEYQGLETWCKETYGFGIENRRATRTAPKVGEERAYKTQGAAGSPIGKIPLKTLGLQPGDTYKARFLDSTIVLSAE